MNFLYFVNHFLHFFLPGIFVALLLPMLQALFTRKLFVKNSMRTIKSQFIMNLGFATATLIFGLVIFGRDGKMLTYFAMLVAVALAQVWQKSKS
jgi:hypothetical protein